VQLLSLLDPSRLAVPVYANYLKRINAIAAEINDKHSSDGWLPIDVRIGDNFPVVVAAYREYDALLVNSIADGMNLISKEAPLLNERSGVVVLSENAGSFEELEQWVLPVDPLDVDARLREHHFGAWQGSSWAALEAASPGAVAAWLATTKGTASQTLMALERKGLIRKARHPSDGRVTRLEATTAGLALLETDPMLGLVEAIARLPPLYAAALSQSLAHIAGELAPDGSKPVFAGCAGCRHLEAKGVARRCRNFAADLSGEEAMLACVAHSPD
jgi:DNA-binding MarR family transcriptional regulator